MLHKPWKLSASLAFGAVLFALGMVLQLSIGSIKWAVLAWPANLFLLVIYLLVLVLLDRFKGSLALVRWLSSCDAATASLAWCALLTVCMGLTAQNPVGDIGSSMGFRSMTSQWGFMLSYAWMLTSLGLTVLRVISQPHPLRRIPFLLFHVGLFTALLCAALGSSDMQRLEMTLSYDLRQSDVIDETGRHGSMPFSVELKDFDIEQYPPVLMIVDNATGKYLPHRSAQRLQIDDDNYGGRLCGWNIEILNYLEEAANLEVVDTLRYTEYHSMGAVPAAFIEASNGDVKVRGWVGAGSFIFPARELPLDGDISLVMPPREPRQFISKVEIREGDEIATEGAIAVNHPLRYKGWRLYQRSYNVSMGRWSRTSVIDLVKDPWLPAVYAGIIMMMAGAVLYLAKYRTDREEGSK